MWRQSRCLKLRQSSRGWLDGTRLDIDGDRYVCLHAASSARDDAYTMSAVREPRSDRALRNGAHDVFSVHWLPTGMDDLAYRITLGVGRGLTAGLQSAAAGST